MPEYTPTTDDVRAVYADSRDGDYYSPTIEKARQYRESGAGRGEFDRWLAARDRENRAIGWDEGFEAGEQDVMEHNRTSWSADCIANPYRGDSQ